MRLWHDSLIPILDHQRLLGQHRECCALRGKGWGRKHSTVNYVFNHSIILLCIYHVKIMNEMKKKKINVNLTWYDANYRGKKLGYVNHFTLPNLGNDIKLWNYPEHNEKYLKECQKLLLERNFDYYSKYFL